MAPQIMLITHVKQKTNPKYLDILEVLPQLNFFNFWISTILILTRSNNLNKNVDDSNTNRHFFIKSTTDVT